MKTVGTTPDGNYLLEANTTEYRALAMLADVIEGKELNYLHYHNASVELDLSTVLGAIVMFASTKDIINRLKHRLQELDNMLMDDKSEGDKMLEFFKDGK